MIRENTEKLVMSLTNLFNKSYFITENENHSERQIEICIYFGIAQEGRSCVEWEIHASKS